jgi:acyl-coenzyme A synthetase/AMP-(fatty) acid ligase
MSTLSHLIQHNYQSAPEHHAIIIQHAGQEEKTISYRTLVEGSINYARAYASEGIRPGEVIILILQHFLGRDSARGNSRHHAFSYRKTRARTLPR